jgi:hypothetical protein
MPSRDKYPQGKRALFVYINEDLYTKIHEIAFSQYDQFHGALSRVVEEALRLYLTINPSPKPAHTHKAQSPVLQGESSKIEEIRHNYEKVLLVYKRLKNFPDHEIICEIPKSDLERIISVTIGYDRRTIDKWIDNFIALNLLTYDSKREVFTVVNSACLDLEHYLDQLKQESNA